MRRLSAFVPLFLFVLLLFFPGLALQGAANGLLLWYRRVLPVLLPFALVSQLMTAVRLPTCFPPRLCVIAMGFACGYPMGAIWASGLTRSGQLSKKEGERLLLFCNQPSPMFLIGYLGLQTLGQARALPLLVCAWLPSALLGALLLLRLPKKTDLPTDENSPSLQPLTLTLFEEAWMEACRILVRIGGYLMLFSILAAIGETVLHPPLLRVLTVGLCEMTTGISLLPGLGLNAAWQGALGLFFSCFGGLSTCAQTLGCLREGPLKGRAYLAARLGCGLMSALLYLSFFGKC